MNIEWEAKYDTGITIIDEQHKKLVQNLNKLSQAVDGGLKREEVKQIFIDLSNYCNYHFSTEEMLMERSNYADFENHKMEHLNCFSKIKNCYRRFENGNDESVQELIDYLKEWWAEHVLITDKEFVPFIDPDIEE